MSTQQHMERYFGRFADFKIGLHCGFGIYKDGRKTIRNHIMRHLNKLNYEGDIYMSYLAMGVKMQRNDITSFVLMIGAMVVADEKGNIYRMYGYGYLSTPLLAAGLDLSEIES